MSDNGTPDAECVGCGQPFAPAQRVWIMGGEHRCTSCFVDVAVAAEEPVTVRAVVGDQGADGDA